MKLVSDLRTVDLHTAGYLQFIVDLDTAGYLQFTVDLRTAASILNYSILLGCTTRADLFQEFLPTSALNYLISLIIS